MSDKEKVIKFILGLSRNTDNRAIWTMDCYRLIEGVSPEQVIDILASLKTDKYLDFTTKDLTDQPVIIMFLQPKIINYFENKKAKTKGNRLETAKWLAPLIISLIALAVSIFKD